MAVGGAFHRLLETWDPGADAAAEEARQRGRIEACLEALLPDGGDLAAPAAAVGRLLDRFRDGGLLARFLALGEGILARELPVLLPPAGETGPAGAVAGSIDLLYRDPATGGLVVADYKTDRVAGDGEIERRAATYSSQGRLYARAVEGALGLAAPPRFEVWFVEAGRVVVA